MTPCDHCPFRGRDDLACPRWPSDHTPFCDWANPSHPAYRPDAAEVLARIARARLGFAGAVTAVSPTQPSEAEALRAMVRADACPHLRFCGCATPGYECAKLGRRIEPGECEACLSGITPGA